MARPRKPIVLDPDSPNARLAQAIQELKVTQADVGRRTEVGAPYVNDVVRGRRSVTEPFAEYLQSEFGINKIWLRYGEGQMLRSLPRAPTTVGTAAGLAIVLLPVLDRPCTGNPLDNDAWPGSTHPVPRSLANPSQPDRYRYMLRLAGCGKRGELRDNDLVLVENAARFGPDDLAGSWCVVRSAGVGRIRRITKAGRGRLEVWGRCVALLWRALA